jgi:hypothetical protein
MTPEDFTKAVDSLVGFAKERNGIVGVMGGEPTLSPHFLEYCKIARDRIPRMNLGLWSVFPQAKRHYREIICETFGVVLLNDHSRDDILHAPVLMAAEEYFRKGCPSCNGTGCEACGGIGTVVDETELFLNSENCWVQQSWSASIHPKGAYFCEVAAALAETFDGPDGWKVEPGWWKRTPMDFKEQRDWACRRCGAAMPIKRIRNSQDEKDDVSPKNLERLKAINSRKVERGDYVVRDFEFDQALIDGGTYPTQTYKNEIYRKGIAARYGISLVMSPRGYYEPRLLESMPKPQPTMFNIINDKFGAKV